MKTKWRKNETSGKGNFKTRGVPMFDKCWLVFNKFVHYLSNMEANLWSPGVFFPLETTELSYWFEIQTVSTVYWIKIHWYLNYTWKQGRKQKNKLTQIGQNKKISHPRNFRRTPTSFNPKKGGLICISSFLWHIKCNIYLSIHHVNMKGAHKFEWNGYLFYWIFLSKTPVFCSHTA